MYIYTVYTISNLYTILSHMLRTKIDTLDSQLQGHRSSINYHETVVVTGRRSCVFRVLVHFFVANLGLKFSRCQLVTFHWICFQYVLVFCLIVCCFGWWFCTEIVLHKLGSSKIDPLHQLETMDSWAACVIPMSGYSHACDVWAAGITMHGASTQTWLVWIDGVDHKTNHTHDYYLPCRRPPPHHHHHHFRHLLDLCLIGVPDFRSQICYDVIRLPVSIWYTVLSLQVPTMQRVCFVVTCMAEHHSDLEPLSGCVFVQRRWPQNVGCCRGTWWCLRENILLLHPVGTQVVWSCCGICRWRCPMCY